jgi:hypothetical protein
MWVKLILRVSAILFWLAVMAVMLVAQTTCIPSGTTNCTPNLNLFLPAHLAPNWDTMTNSNFSLLDQYLGGQLSLPVGMRAVFFDAGAGYRVNGSYGAANQVLESTGTGSQWVSLPSVILPAPPGNPGEVLINSNGAFGSIPGFVYDPVKYTLDGKAVGPNGLSISANFFGAEAGFAVDESGGFIQNFAYNLATSGLSNDLIACMAVDGSAHVCPVGSQFWTGIVWALNSTTLHAGLTIAGFALCLFDNTATTGDFVVMSAITPGQCHDTGSASVPSTGIVVGQVNSAPSGGVAPVNLMHANGGGGGGSLTIHCSVVNGGNSLNGCATQVGVVAGMQVTGPGLASNTTVTGLIGTNQIGITPNAIATNAGAYVFTALAPGNNGEVIINSNGALGSIPGLVYTPANNSLIGSNLSLAVATAFGNTVGVAVNGGYVENLPYNASTGGLAPNLMACMQGDGTAHVCPTTATYWDGLNVTTGNDSQSRPVASSMTRGTGSCLFDNTPVLGDLVNLSTITAGQCHDLGSSSPPAEGVGALAGRVIGAPTGSVAPIFLMHSGDAPVQHGAITFATGTLSNPTFGNAMFTPTKLTASSTLQNVVAAAPIFSCSANPVITLEDCGTSGGTCATPTALASVTVTAANTIVDGTITNPTLTIGHYLVWETTSGTCSSVSINGNASY